MAEAFNRCATPPPVLIQASTTAIYGDAGERWCDESWPPGDGVGVATATKWKAPSPRTPRRRARARVLLRISFVLGHGGGVLRMLATMTRCFLGGSVGSGRQYISWVHLDDLCRVVLHTIDHESMHGTYNVATPNPVTNAEFMRSPPGLPWPVDPPAPAWAVHVGCFLLRTEPILALTGRRGRATIERHGLRIRARTSSAGSGFSPTAPNDNRANIIRRSTCPCP